MLSGGELKIKNGFVEKKYKQRMGVNINVNT